MTNKTVYIAQLPHFIQSAIKNDIKLALIDINLTAEEKEVALQDAMDSRLCDLEDIIDIKKYI